MDSKNAVRNVRVVEHGRKRPSGGLRKIARWVGAVSAVFWTFSLSASFIGELLGGVFQPSLEGLLLAILMTAAVVGVIIAWGNEGRGGAIVTISAIALCVFAYFSAGHRKFFAVAVSGGPFLIAGILFLASWWKSRIL